MMIIKIVLCLAIVLSVINTIRIGELETNIEAIIEVIRLVKENIEKEERE